MAEASTFLATKRYAVVTGGNRGIGFEICRQLASNGVMVVLTARDEKKGIEALEKLKDHYCLSEHLVFHQLDVVDPSSVASLAGFINNQFGKLDILVNNAAISGVIMDTDAVKRAYTIHGPGEIKWNEMMTHTYNLGEECLETNYYGAKRVIEALIPLLQSSDSPRIVNVSSVSGKLKFIPNEWAKGVFLDEERLSEERVGEVLNKFLKDFKEGDLDSQNWPCHLSAYTLSKAAVNAYTRVLAKKYPNFLINSVCPGYVKTEMNCDTGILTVEEGAQNATRLALLPEGAPSGLFFAQKELSSL